MLIEQVASDEAIDKAFDWLCQKRKDYHYNNDVWQLRRWWHEKKPKLIAQLLAGNFRFGEQRRVMSRGEVKEIWSAQDALVLKALAIVLQEVLLPHLSPRCFHQAETGGLKGAVREVDAHLHEFEFVFRTDVKGYYASIDHDILFCQVAEYVRDPVVLDLVGQYLRRFVSDGGIYVDIQRGISLGCPLSPLMGALYLKPLDDRMAAMGCFYVRYMDDWVVLAPTRWALRRAIEATNQVMADLKVEKHPDKTFIGRVGRGFVFLGYRFAPGGLAVARVTVERFFERVSRLYEQNATASRIEEYARRWLIWVRSGVQRVELEAVGVDSVQTSITPHSVL
ncbi:MAG: reverse transcriptase/maturase family protein [Trichodesmium sp. MO_231.B1]|nr:reverse transcriptase/maturase family protein [Trichodesmium sp. MO_231.B1]